MKSSNENVRIFFRRKTVHYKFRLQQQECQALFPTKVWVCGSGLKTQPEGQALSKISVLGDVDSGKQKCLPSFASANKVINKDKHMEMLIQHVMAWIRRVYTDGAYAVQQGRQQSSLHIRPRKLKNFWSWKMRTSWGWSCNPCRYPTSVPWSPPSGRVWSTRPAKSLTGSWSP